jgi:hypothetical protein
MNVEYWVSMPGVPRENKLAIIELCLSVGAASDRLGQSLNVDGVYQVRPERPGLVCSTHLFGYVRCHGFNIVQVKMPSPYQIVLEPFYRG